MKNHAQISDCQYIVLTLFCLCPNTDLVDRNACSSNPCANGATCREVQGLYACNCDIGWEGLHCNVDFDECLSDPCRNGGTCINNLAHFVCHCMPDFEGLVCQIGKIP